MKRVSLTTLLTIALVACSCASSDDAPAVVFNDPRGASAAAEATLEKIRQREYEAIYDAATPGFRETNSRDEFLAKMRALDQFGKLVDAVAGEPATVPDDAAVRVRVPVAATFVLGEGPIELTYRGMEDGWRLDYYSYDVAATTYDPPYPADTQGADRLSHRFMYLWQTRRYDELARIMPIDEDADEVKSFLARMEPAGALVNMKRRSYTAARGGGVAAEYDLRFEKGRGFIVYTLVERDDQWAIDEIKYDVEYRTEGAAPAG
jgi:hypothetical protein